jgi:dihydrofolate reductase
MLTLYLQERDDTRRPALKENVMRKVILFVNATIDGYLAGPSGELDWMLPDPAMNQQLTDELRGEVDTILIGRVIYHAFDQNFRAEAANPASPPGLVDFANWMIDTPKVVFSRTLSDVNEGDRLAKADLADEVAALKAEPGKAMVLFGGVATAQQFVRHGLVDEYWIKAYPIALGAGQPLFTDLEQRANLTLTHAQAHDSGIVTLRYVPA